MTLLGVHGSPNSKPDGHLILESVRSILSSGRPDDAISGDLAELLGFDELNLDLVTDILSNRSQFFEEPSAAMQGVAHATVSDPRSLAPDQVRRRMEEQLQANASRPLFTGTAVSHTPLPGSGASRIELRRAARKTGDSTSCLHFSFKHWWRRCAF